MRAYESMGNYEAWFELWKKQKGYRFDDSFISDLEKILEEQGYMAVIEALINYNEEKHRKGECIAIAAQAGMYLKIGNYDRAIDYFEEMYEIKDPNLPILIGNPQYSSELKDNPRYIALLKKMNLPLP
jgi:tetratricopeptide (TPR) repeat protein